MFVLFLGRFECIVVFHFISDAHKDLDNLVHL